MAYFNNGQLAQISQSLQPLLFAPKHFGNVQFCDNWRKAMFDARVSAGEFDSKSPEWVSDVKDMLDRGGSDSDMQAHIMQLLAFLLNGAVKAVCQDSDLEDMLISESMLFSASMRLSQSESYAVKDAVSDFVNKLNSIFYNQFGLRSRLTDDEIRQLSELKLLRWE